VKSTANKLSLHQNSKNPSRKPKITPNFTEKKQKILIINPKTDKTPFYPLLFLLKKGQIVVIFMKKGKKKRKNRKKGEKR